MFNNTQSFCEIKKSTIINMSAELKKIIQQLLKSCVFLITINSLLLNMKLYMWFYLQAPVGL